MDKNGAQIPNAQCDMIDLASQSGAIILDLASHVHSLEWPVVISIEPPNYIPTHIYTARSRCLVQLAVIKGGIEPLAADTEVTRKTQLFNSYLESANIAKFVLRTIITQVNDWRFSA